MKKPPTRESAPPVRILSDLRGAPNPRGDQACSGDPGCVWPAAALGLCAHHYRMLFEAPLWEDEPDPEEDSTVPPELLAQLQAEYERRKAAVHKPCANPSCANVLRASNRLGLCKVAATAIAPSSAGGKASRRFRSNNTWPAAASAGWTSPRRIESWSD